MGLVSWKRGTMKPLVIFLTALGLGMLVLGITLTIIGTLPSYSPYGGNPLKVVGPILLVLGVLTLMGVTVEWCVRSQRLKDEPEFVEVDYSKPAATYKAASHPHPRRPTHEPPLQTSTPGNNTQNPPSPVFRPQDALASAQVKLASRPEPRSTAPLPSVPQDGQANGHRPHGMWQEQLPPQKTAHFQPIDQAPVTSSVQYTQVVHPQRQPSSSSANYFFPSVTNRESTAPYPGPSGNGANGDNLNRSKLRWGSSTEELEDKKELPVLDIANAGRGGKHGGYESRSKGSGPGDKYGRSGSYREAHRHDDNGKPAKSPKVERRHRDDTATDSRKRYSAENPAFVNEMPVDVPSESTPKDRTRDRHRDRDRDRDAYSSSHNNSRDEPHDGTSNFNRRNSSRTRRGSKRRQHSSRGSSREREKDRDRDRNRERDRDRQRDRSHERAHRERSSSRGRLGLDDSSTLDYVRGVPLDKDSRRRSGQKPSASSDHRSLRHQQYDSDDSRAHYAKLETPDSNSPSGGTRSDHGRPHHHGGSSNHGYENNDERALSPRGSTDFLSSKMVSDGKNFTININAQPGSAVQIALGNQNLPTPRPMITATPLKTEVHTAMEDMA